MCDSLTKAIHAGTTQSAVASPYSEDGDILVTSAMSSGLQMEGFVGSNNELHKVNETVSSVLVSTLRQSDIFTV